MATLDELIGVVNQVVNRAIAVAGKEQAIDLLMESFRGMLKGLDLAELEIDMFRVDHGSDPTPEELKIIMRRLAIDQIDKKFQGTETDQEHD